MERIYGIDTAIQDIKFFTYTQSKETVIGISARVSQATTASFTSSQFDNGGAFDDSIAQSIHETHRQSAILLAKQRISLDLAPVMTGHHKHNLWLTLKRATRGVFVDILEDQLSVTITIEGMFLFLCKTLNC